MEATVMSFLPILASRFFKIPSANGLRHIFPVQIKTTFGKEWLHKDGIAYVKK